MKFENGNHEINLMPNGTRWVDINEIKHVMTPKHYDNQQQYDVIDIIKDYDLNFNEGNAVKYIVRASRKGAHLEDHEKRCTTLIEKLYTTRLNLNLKINKMKQETLEEAAEKYNSQFVSQNEFAIEDFINGAKWQADRMYSEEEVKDMLFEALNKKQEQCCITITKDSIVREVLKQFKNK